MTKSPRMEWIRDYQKKSGCDGFAALKAWRELPVDHPSVWAEKIYFTMRNNAEEVWCAANALLRAENEIELKAARDNLENALAASVPEFP